MFAKLLAITNYSFMKKLVATLILMVLINSSIIAQDCTLYIPSDVGTELFYQTTNDKGKIEGTYTQKMISVQKIDGQTVFELLQTFMDPKSPESILIQDTIRFRCKGNVFYIDMEKYLDQKQMDAFKGMEVKITTEDLIYPSKLSPGLILNDGFIKMEVQTGMMNMTMLTNIVNRKVEAREEVTTSAGNFTCYKISEDIQSKMGFVNMQRHNVSWIVEDIGTIRSESYNKKGKLDGITELIKIVR